MFAALTCVTFKFVLKKKFCLFDATDELAEFYANLTKLIEVTYAENGNSSVVMIAHSMGNPVMLYFYNHKPQEWKDKYIRAHLSLAGVWAGAVKPVRLMTSGEHGLRSVISMGLGCFRHAENVQNEYMVWTTCIMSSATGIRYHPVLWHCKTGGIIKSNAACCWGDMVTVTYFEGHKMWDCMGIVCEN